MSTLLASTLISEGEKAESNNNHEIPGQTSLPPPSFRETPMVERSGNSEGSELGYESVEHQRPALEAELRGCEFEDETLGARVFKDVARREAIIKTFLDQSPLYNRKTKRWTLPPKPKLERDLYQPYRKLIDAIICYFRLKDDRKVLVTDKAYLPHVEGSDIASKFPDPTSSIPATDASSLDPTSTFTAMPSVERHPDIPLLKSSPDICIQAAIKDKQARNNFPFLEGRASKSYRMTVSPIEIKTERNFLPQADRIQVAVYARQIFAQQGNRHIVNCFIFTEKNARVYVFGRDGVHYSTPINIHESPEVFVRFILGAASMRADVVGFDESVYWKNGTRYIETVDSNNNPITLSLGSIGKPVFFRRTIRGRGTTCWKGQNEAGEFFLIKDGWKSVDRISESDHLKDVAGISGVGQMQAFQNGIKKLSALRNIIGQTLSEELQSFFRDREFCRIVLDYYGRSIEGFKLRSELLYAYHDAICGYQNLYNEGILHRDISVNNILIGKPDSESPNRGVVIDLDMAIRLERLKSLDGTDFKTGTRAFQSINILRSYQDQYTINPHTYMDDLESFFYVLCWVCCGYSGPSQRCSEFPSYLLRWENCEPTSALNDKAAIFSQGFSFDNEVSNYFGESFCSLLTSLSEYFSEYIHREVMVHIPNPVWVIPSPEDAFATILKFISNAIEAVEAEEKAQAQQVSMTISPSDVPTTTPTRSKQRSGRMIPPPPPKHSTSLRSRGSSSGKRSSEHGEEGAPATKRSRTSTRTQVHAPSSLNSSSVAD